MAYQKYEKCVNDKEGCTKGDTPHIFCNAAPGYGGTPTDTCINGTKGCPKSDAPHFFCGG